MSLQNYFKEIEEKVHQEYDLATEARKKGLDPKPNVEIDLTTTLAQRALGVVSLKYPQIKNEQIEKRFKELEKQYGFLDPAVAFKIAEEVAKERFCKFKDLLEGIDAGICIGLAYLTMGVVISPLEGYTHLKLKKTKDGRDYLAVYYSGPIRSAGATAGAISLVLADYLRETFGYAKYDPTDIEIRRAATEIHDYHERITNLQYIASEEEIHFLIKNCPVQIDGLASENREVSNYKDLDRVETNRLRSGYSLVVSEQLAQKAKKVVPRIKKLRERGFKLSDWDFLEDFVNFQKRLIAQKTSEETGTYIQDAVAGRPIFGHPSRSGAFRLRYGRARTSGYSSLAISSSTMKILSDFIASATQLKLEKPTKGTAIGLCDSIDGPIIKLKDGSVVYVGTREAAEKYVKDIDEILYVGDMLVSYGDFYDRNHNLLPPGYVPEWWRIQVKETLKYKPNEEIEKLFKEKITLDNAKKISEVLNIPLHPEFIFFWSQVKRENFIAFLDWLSESKIVEGKLLLPYETLNREKYANAKRALEIAGVEHQVTTANVVLEKTTWNSLFLNLGLESDLIEKAKELARQFEKSDDSILEFINKNSKFKIKDKAGTFIGSRMGRPEKAKPRELTGSPNSLFPIGEEGGRMRSLQTAVEVGTVKADFPIYYCEECKKESVYPICDFCGKENKKLFYCSKCTKKIDTNFCNLHGKGQTYSTQRINIKDYFKNALERANKTYEFITINPKLVKGVRGTSNENHTPEHLCKGILRAAFGLAVNKDGSMRFDCSEVPITHFKPKEVRVSIDKLKELGYTQDYEGKELTNDDQILEIKPCDIILPCAKDSLDIPADDFFFRATKFLDALLVNFYGLKPYYNLETKEDLAGHYVIGIAPHNAAGIAARIVGFSDTQGFLASPFIHGAVRRDCDGDEAGMMLLLDAFLNFSREFLPIHRGGTQDSPVVLNSRLRSNEVDEMVYNIDTVKEYPLELYMAAEKGMHPKDVEISRIEDRMGQGDRTFEGLWFTHHTSNINSGTNCSAYKTLATMPEKVERQMDLARKLRAVNTSDVARLVIDRHFVRDIKGNFHKFTRQQFRCVKCNEKYRRPPLAGKCLRCGGRIIFTIAEGSIKKYLEPAIRLAEEFNISPYTKQSLMLVKQSIESVFGVEKEKQEKLDKWFKKCTE
ncbi:MAG: DNA polymerase II large subunit [archaeon]|nr:MAG: DNA polymerase II large subunit [archaeon]